MQPPRLRPTRRRRHRAAELSSAVSERSWVARRPFSERPVPLGPVFTVDRQILILSEVDSERPTRPADAWLAANIIKLCFSSSSGLLNLTFMALVGWSTSNRKNGMFFGFRGGDAGPAPPQCPCKAGDGPGCEFGQQSQTSSNSSPLDCYILTRPADSCRPGTAGVLTKEHAPLEKRS
eukprot:365521-Chlamydomonas_euryale.AAC.2